MIIIVHISFLHCSSGAIWNRAEVSKLHGKREHCHLQDQQNSIQLQFIDRLCGVWSDRKWNHTNNMPYKPSCLSKTERLKYYVLVWGIKSRNFHIYASLCGHQKQRFRSSAGMQLLSRIRSKSETDRHWKLHKYNLWLVFFSSHFLETKVLQNIILSTWEKK